MNAKKKFPTIDSSMNLHINRFLTHANKTQQFTQ